MALTATANEQAKEDIVNKLGLRDCVMLTSSFNRRNLYYDIRKKTPGSIVRDIASYIKSMHADHSGIIYCLARQKCEDVAKELRNSYGLSAQHFHAQMSAAEKERALNDWQNGLCKIIVATVGLAS
jgi:superfamily II DNA helicase RecQ